MVLEAGVNYDKKFLCQNILRSFLVDLLRVCIHYEVGDCPYSLADYGKIWIFIKVEILLHFACTSFSTLGACVRQ